MRRGKWGIDMKLRRRILALCCAAALCGTVLAGCGGTDPRRAPEQGGAISEQSPEEQPRFPGTGGALASAQEQNWRWYPDETAAPFRIEMGESALIEESPVQIRVQRVTLAQLREMGLRCAEELDAYMEETTEALIAEMKADAYCRETAALAVDPEQYFNISFRIGVCGNIVSAAPDAMWGFWAEEIREPERYELWQVLSRSRRFSAPVFLYDGVQEKKIALSDLFCDGADYMAAIERELRAELRDGSYGFSAEDLLKRPLADLAPDEMMILPGDYWINDWGLNTSSLQVVFPYPNRYLNNDYILHIPLDRLQDVLAAGGGDMREVFSDAAPFVRRFKTEGSLPLRVERITAGGYDEMEIVLLGEGDKAERINRALRAEWETFLEENSVSEVEKLLGEECAETGAYAYGNACEQIGDYIVCTGTAWCRGEDLWFSAAFSRVFDARTGTCLTLSELIGDRAEELLAPAQEYLLDSKSCALSADGSIRVYLSLRDPDGVQKLGNYGYECGSIAFPAGSLAEENW